MDSLWIPVTGMLFYAAGWWLRGRVACAYVREWGDFMRLAASYVDADVAKVERQIEHAHEDALLELIGESERANIERVQLTAAAQAAETLATGVHEYPFSAVVITPAWAVLGIVWARLRNLVLWARLQQGACQLPACMCPQALLYVWPVGKALHYELRTRDGKRFEGGARTEEEAKIFAGVTLHDEGLKRCRLIHQRPVEVPRG